MHPIEARDLAWELLRRHRLAEQGWTFRFDHARRRFGSCQYRAKRVTLSHPLTLLNGPAEVRDTLLHEIAHALAPGDGHGRKWKAKCVEIGARPERCYDDDTVKSPPRRPAPYRWGCGGCGWWVERRRRTRRRYICAKCRKPLTYRERLTDGASLT